MATAARSKPPGLPASKLRTGWELLTNPNILEQLRAGLGLRIDPAQSYENQIWIQELQSTH